MKTKTTTSPTQNRIKPKLSVLPKLDLYKAHRAEYVMRRKPELVEIGPAVYLSIRGQGAPGGEAFGRCIAALYAMAFTIKMTRKFAGHQDYAVCKLECLYGLDGQGDAFCEQPREEWEWELLIRTPAFITQVDLTDALKALQSRKRDEGAGEVKLKKLKEGLCVQMLHVGPYSEEGRTVQVLQQFAAARGLEFSGHHHEIYISDPRRVKPEKLKTLLRHSVTGAKPK